MLKFIQKKIVGTNEVVEEHDIDIKILNSENIKVGDYLYVSEDGRNLDAQPNTELRQIFATYLGDNKVLLDNYIEFVSGVDKYKEYNVCFKGE